ncbi:hypothetical protein [Roseibium sp.]|uniref:hypothetical protein n=1 Tax=Roseibium sp. TaxID=1936156 RepID=UPI003A977D07
MGEAKRKRAVLARLIQLSKPIKQTRFDLYALGTRQSLARYMAEELSWWSDQEEQLIGFVFRDTTDNDFGWIMLARDRVGRFRCVKLEASLPSEAYATVGLRKSIGLTLETENIRELGVQGDEPNAPTDLLSVADGVDRSKLHPYFLELLERPGREPARAVVREIGPWLAPADPHSVQEFQQNQFDQRLWELYLWAALRELGFDVEQLEAPDFRCKAPGVNFTIEATTAAPSTMGPLAEHPNPNTQEETRDFLENYMPLKYGSALVSKLNKTNKTGQHYWERDGNKGLPFLLAIADFHKPATTDELGSMTYTQSAIWQYLYGTRVAWEWIEGQLILTSSKIASHKYRDKEAPSGFFDLPGAENISAVLFSNAGTISKFDRMGVVAGFPAAQHEYQRFGIKLNPDPNAATGLPFFANVLDDSYTEYWSDELQVFHNPNAKLPVPPEWFAGVAQHQFIDGDLYSFGPEHQVLSSYTMIMKIIDDQSDEV